MSHYVPINAANPSLNVATANSYTAAYTTVVTENNILEHAHALVMKGLQEMSPNDLAQILCEKFVNQEDYGDYIALTRINKNNYIQILKILLNR